MAMSDELNERSLVEAAQADPARFLDLYDRHFHRVYAYVLRRAGNRADAEDVTSEVFHRALANLKDYVWRGVPFAAWLFRIAANELTDRRRHAARESGDPPPDRQDTEKDSDVERRAGLDIRVGRAASRRPATRRRSAVR